MNIAEQINQNIIEWLGDKPKLVVALDGHVGVGKTTVLKNLCEINPDILPVSQDDFLLVAETFVPGNNNYAEIEKLVAAFRSGQDFFHTKIFNPASKQSDIDQTYDLSKKVMIVDGIFMFDPNKQDHLWDRRIYLDGDEEAIRERRIKREKARWGDKYRSEDRPDSHFGQVIRALKDYRQAYEPEKKADLVIVVD